MNDTTGTIDTAGTTGTKTDNEYRVLARKYRPTTFSELIGQEAMVKTLSNAIATGRLAHAFILTGVRGVGKTTTARLIARALNCIGADGKGDITVEPCGQCDNCLSIGESRNVDVLEMDAASRTGVDDVREIIDSVRYAPASARFKVYIIDEVHMLSKNAFNALLKTLEEPPPHVKFIFATTEIRKLPVTVLSRCQRFDLRRVEAEVLIAHLKTITEKENAEIDDAALTMIVRAAEGSVRDGLSLLDQAIAHGGGTVSADQVRQMMGLADRAKVLDLFRAIMAGDVKAALLNFREQYDLGVDPAVIMKDLAETTHWLTRLKVVPEAGSDQLTSEAELKEGLEMAETLAMPHLTRAWQMILKGIGEVQMAAAPLVVGEMVLIRLCYAADLPSPAELVKKLENDPAPLAASASAAPAVAAPPPDSGGPTPTPGPTATPEAVTEPPASEALSNASEAPVANIGAPRVNMDAQVIALDILNEGEHAAEPLPISFKAMVDLFHKKKRGVIASFLHDDVRVVSYKPGAVCFCPVRSIPATIGSDMRQCLKEWTGDDWQVSIASNGGDATLREDEEAEMAVLKAEAMSDPLVENILKSFDGAEITMVKALDTLKDEI
jgi:DNA polymerase III subunit gamma/tau